MNWILNKKCFAALRAICAKTTARWKYMHVSKAGVVATDMVSMIRVSLPTMTRVSLPINDTLPEPMVYDYETALSLIPKGDSEVIMPKVGPNPAFSVPKFEYAVPQPKNQIASCTVDAQRLIDILKGAMDVTDHARNMVRLRFYKDFLRVDAHKDMDGQEFMGLMSCIKYNGNSIPGDPPAGVTVDGQFKPNPETAEQGSMVLPMFEGRKFRDEKE